MENEFHVATDDGQALVEQLHAAGLGVEPIAAAPNERARFGERRLESALPDPEFVAVALAGAAAFSAMARVVVEIIRSGQSKVLVRRPDGTVIEFEGDLSQPQVERLLASADD